MTNDAPADPLAPYAGHQGHVGPVFATSTSWWPEPIRPREGAPNIVVMMCDDLGFADLGCYGSEIPTPHLDRIAAEGLRYTDYHSTPMCSPRPLWTRTRSRRTWSASTAAAPAAR